MYVLDTNVLIHNDKALETYPEVIIPIVVLEELDKLKLGEGELSFKARRAIKALYAHKDIVYDTNNYLGDIPDGWDPEKRDNVIVLSALANQATLVSNDINVIIKGNSLAIECRTDEVQVNDEYSGYITVEMTESELAIWYSNKQDLWDMEVNQYLYLSYEGKVIDQYVKTSDGFRAMQVSKINSTIMGNVTPLDHYQVAAFDTLINNQMTMICGKAGTGKSLLTLAYAMYAIEKSKYDQLIVFCNTVATKNSAKLGFYKGSREEKLLDSQIGNMLTSKLGDKHVLDDLIRLNRLVLLPFSDIRGYDTTGMRAIVWIAEAQNLDIELMRLAIQRVGDDCKLVVDGDYRAQVDSTAYEGSKNGMRRASEVFKGQDFYGQIELKSIYRSKLAEIADRM